MASLHPKEISKIDNVLNSPSPAVDGISIDCVIFGFKKGSLEVLLVQHASGESEGNWGLLGGWMKREESADDAAHRILYELTTLENIYLEQLKAFTNPKRVLDRRIVTIGYYTLVNQEDYDVNAQDNFADSEADAFTSVKRQYLNAVQCAAAADSQTNAYAHKYPAEDRYQQFI